MKNASLKILHLNDKAESRALLSIRLKAMPIRFARIRQYITAILTITMASWLCFELAQVIGYYIFAFILLILVSLLATILKTGPVLFASIVSILIWNFFFIPPHHTFHI